MADANHKARPPVTERSVTIQESWRYQKPARLPFHMCKEPATFPWMKLSGRWIETAGFEPGQRVRITNTRSSLLRRFEYRRAARAALRSRNDVRSSERGN
ncbi:toxic protein SymE [Paraburkholderia sp. GAS38]|uniref:SymE family type I addiction module toxin n=1 Tax=Paraburkholderia sp. GAS38 TaxID=3035133 RepID=UPI003D1D6959